MHHLQQKFFKHPVLL